MQTYYEGDNREEEEKVGNLGREESLSFSLWQHLTLLQHQIDEGKYHAMYHRLQKSANTLKDYSKGYKICYHLGGWVKRGRALMCNTSGQKPGCTLRKHIWLTNRSSFHLNHHSWMLPFSSKSLEMGHTEKTRSKMPWSRNAKHRNYIKQVAF